MRWALTTQSLEIQATFVLEGVTESFIIKFPLNILFKQLHFKIDLKVFAQNIYTYWKRDMINLCNVPFLYQFL